MLALRHYRAQQGAIREKLGSAFTPETPLFARADGSMIHPESLSKACVRLSKEAGLKGVHLHSLRHTQASLLLAQGEYPKVISERLGHASIAITNDLYSHLVSGMEQAAAAMVDVALEGGDFEHGNRKLGEIDVQPKIKSLYPVDRGSVYAKKWSR